MNLLSRRGDFSVLIEMRCDCAVERVREGEKVSSIMPNDAVVELD